MLALTTKPLPPSVSSGYRLTRDAPTPGTPERPLSDLGLKGYLSFWTSLVVRVLQDKVADLPTAPAPPPLSTSTSSLVQASAVHEASTQRRATRAGGAVAASKAEKKLDVDGQF